MDTLTANQRSKLMSRVKGKDTTPERIVRRIAHGLGYRFRLHCAKLPGKPDLVFPRLRRIIFVHGCFWHLHTCRQGMNAPKTNVSFWNAKREGNKARDGRVRRELRRLGWEVLVIWECQCRNTAKIRDKVNEFLGGKGGRRKR
jgi:DNA mismatch endonuclease (patch repair protein)